MSKSSFVGVGILLIVACLGGIAADCVYKGMAYLTGPIVTVDPCDHCTCLPDGTTPCAIIDCLYPWTSLFCPDGSLPVHKEGLCCPVCNSHGSETTTP